MVELPTKYSTIPLVLHHGWPSFFLKKVGKLRTNGQHACFYLCRGESIQSY